MATDYDPIAEQYRRCKQHPWRTEIEAFTLLKLIGPLAGKTVLDLACGEGFYTRRLRHLGAAKIVGIDLSQGMIELAQKQEAEQRLGIEYLVGDCMNLHLPVPSDLAVAAYLLNYARNRAELAAMCGSIARSLVPGGRFVTVNSNPACDFRVAPAYRQYGFETRIQGEPVEGTPVTWTIHLEETSFDIENYYIDVATHEACLREAGFREIRWHHPQLSPQGESEFGNNFWQAFLNHPPITFLECLK